MAFNGNCAMCPGVAGTTPISERILFTFPTLWGGGGGGGATIGVSTLGKFGVYEGATISGWR